MNSKALTLPNQVDQFIIECDASDTALGTVLLQLQNDREEAVKFASRQLKGAELNYSTFEKELLAILFSIEKFKHHLWKKFTIRTDHKPILWLKEIKDPNNRVQRWKIKLSEYDFTIVHKPGKFNTIPDYLSRILIIKQENLTEQNKKSYIHDCHILTGHGGRDATNSLLKQTLKWKGMKTDVDKYVKSCNTCIEYSNNNNPFKIPK